MKELVIVIALMMAVLTFGSIVNRPATFDFAQDEHVGARLREMVESGRISMLPDVAYAPAERHAAGSPS